MFADLDDHRWGSRAMRLVGQLSTLRNSSGDPGWASDLSRTRTREPIALGGGRGWTEDSSQELDLVGDHQLVLGAVVNVEMIYAGICA
jgi:hypothetical protein